MEARPPLWRSVAENPQSLIFAACIIALTAFVGSELWQTVQTAMYRPTVKTSSSPTNSEQQSSLAEQIGAAELFGRATKQNNLPETSLQLTLRAVFSAQDPHHASAIIETSDGHAQVVKAGASIGGDAILQEVHEDRIVLSRNGLLETLPFPAPQESNGMAIAQNTPLPSQNAEANPDILSTPPAGASPDEIKRAAILQRLEELRARSPR